MTTTGAETEANCTTVRRAFDAWQDGSALITDVFASDMVWRTESHSIRVPRPSSAARWRLRISIARVITAP